MHLKCLLNAYEIPPKHLPNTAQIPQDTPGIAVNSKTREITSFDAFLCFFFDFFEFSFSQVLALGEGFAYFGLQIRIQRKKLYI